MKKVLPGDRLRIPASTFNTMVDAARDFQDRQRSLSRRPQSDERKTDIISVRNDSGGDVARFDVLEVSAPIFTPSENATEFKQRVVVKGVAPTEDGNGKFVVALEPIAKNAIGRAVIVGAAIARVRVVSETHGHADVAEKRTNCLESGAAGSARILWAEPDEDRNETHLYKFEGTATTGTFTMTLAKAGGGTGTTAAIAWNAGRSTVSSTIAAALGVNNTVAITHDGAAISEVWITYDGEGYAGQEFELGSVNYSGLTGVTDCEGTNEEVAWAVLRLGGAGATPAVTARIVCNGPQGEPPPTTNNYWLKVTQLRGVADPEDPDEPPVTDLKEGDVFLAVNLAEQLTGTHGLRVGTEVIAWQQGDSAGASRWVFCLVPNILLEMFGGLFSAAGITRCSGLAYLNSDTWCSRTPVMPWHDPDDIGIGPPLDFAEFHGRDETHTYMLAGEPKSGTFLLTLERHDLEMVDTDRLDCRASDAAVTGAIRRALQSPVTVKLPKRSETHTYTLEGQASAGTFTLTLEKSDHADVKTAEIEWDAAEAVVTTAVRDALDADVSVAVEYIQGGNAIAAVAITLDAGNYKGRSWKTGTLDYAELTGVGGYKVQATAEPLTGLSITFDHRLYMGRSWNLGALDYSQVVGVTGCNVEQTTAATGGELHRYRFNATPTAGSFALRLLDNEGNEGTTPAIAWNASQSAAQAAVDVVMGSNQTRVELVTDDGAITELVIHLSGEHYAHWSWPLGTADVSSLAGVSTCSVTCDIWAFHFVAGYMSLPRAPTVGQYAFGYRRESDPLYTGFDIENGLISGEGRCLCVYAGKLYLGQLGGIGDGIARTDLRRATWNDHTATWTKESIGWREEIGGTNPIPLNMMVVEREGAEELVVIGQFGDDAGYHCIAFYNQADGGSYFDPGGCGTGEGALLLGLCLHDFEDNASLRLVVCGKFATIGGLSGSPNVASYDLVEDAWLPCGGGVSLAVLTACYSVASFNHRLWLARGYSPLEGQPTGESLRVLANGPGQTWKGASAFVKDLDVGGGPSDDGSAFWGYQWDGTSSVPASAAINEVCVYGNRLIVGGGQQFRTIRRGRKYCGPVVGYDETEKRYQGLTEYLRGEVHALLPFNGGIAVGGQYEVRLADGRVLRNVAVWHEPPVWGDEGTWDDLGGGTDGSVHALAVYEGHLYVGGRFNTAGGVAAKGLGWWDGSTWHGTANFSDYGTVLALCVAGGDLIVAGDFRKADGQSRFGCMSAWDGTKLAAVYTQIAAADDLPLIRALCYHDGYLYAGGWFNLLDIAAISSVGRRQYPGNHAWQPLNNGGGSPPNGIATPGTVWSLCAHASRIYVGIEPGSKPNGEADLSALWTWNPASPDWTRAYNWLLWGNQPVTALYSNGSYIWFGADAVINSPGWIEAYGTKHRIYRQTIPGGTPTTVGADGDGPYFEHAVLAVCCCAANGTARLFAGGRFQSIGTIISAASKTCNLITSIGEDDRIHDIRGGLGLAGYYAQFTTPQYVQRVRPLRSNDLDCERLAICGNFSTMNESGSQHLCGIDLRGRLVGVQGGLAGSNRYQQVGAQDGVTDLKAIPRDQWPEYWEALFTRRADEVHLPFLYLIGGSFSVAINDDIPLVDQADIPETMQTPGIIAHYGDYFRRVLPESAGLPQYCMAVAVYDGRLVHLGATTPPAWCDGDEEAGEWRYYVEPETAGALVGGGQHLIVWQDRLFVAGYLMRYPDSEPGGDVAAVAEYDGADYTLDMIAGLGDADAGKHGNYFLVADLDDGQGECLFLAAQPADATTQCPVYRLSVGGSWTAVGGASQLRGTAYALAVIMHDDGRRLVVQGSLKVYHDGNWVNCYVAMWDGSAWRPVAWIGELDVCEFRMTSDTWGYSGDEQGRSRVIVCGRIAEFADDPNKIGTDASLPGYGMIAVAQDGSLSDLPRGRGVNGLVMAADSAARIIFGQNIG